MKSPIGNSLCLFATVALIISIAAVPVCAQGPQPTTQPQHRASSQASEAGAAPNTVQLPIFGKGTTNFIPLWTGTYTIGNSLLSQTGNGLNVAGAVTAVSFTGNGATLTNVPAVQLGGLPASAFAQVGITNTFTADQTINGNLNLTGYINGTLFLQGNLTDGNGQQSANVLGGFEGAAAGGGNSIAPGVIGATIAGGGGVYDSSVIPKRPSRKRPMPHVPVRDRSQLRNPFLIPSRPTEAAQTAEDAETDLQTPMGLQGGGNIVQSMGDWGTVGGGLQNTVYLFATVSGGRSNTATGAYSTIAGGDGNTASNLESTVGGGSNNVASGTNTTVTGGGANQAVNYGDFVGGGDDNTANNCLSGNMWGACNTPQNGEAATVAGGYGNVASAPGATVGGGYGNNASGFRATIPGGDSNFAAGNFSFAAGCGGGTNFEGSFVWNGAQPVPGVGVLCPSVEDSAGGQFIAAAPGGFYFYSDIGGNGAYLPAGSGSWSSISDRNVKDNFALVDGASVLLKIVALPISTWNYKAQHTSIRHMGPMAQDFREAFGLGEDDTHISNIDSEGVALAAVQALYKLDQEKDGKIAELNQALSEKTHQLEDLERRLVRLEQLAANAQSTSAGSGNE
jgi:Chaperone of endosialidase